jgi:lipopolysaccharide export system protein LptA
VTTSLFSISGDTNRAGMTITSERLEFDYKEFVVAFDGRVRVSDQQFNLTADRVLVFLAGTNQIARILAIGSVNISQTDRRATCDRAVYEKDTGKVSLTGTPVLTRGNDRITGSEVVIFLNDQRVIVTDGRMWIAPESMKNRELAP